MSNSNPTSNPTSKEMLQAIWTELKLDPAYLPHARLPEQGAGLPSSYAIGTAAQSSIGAAALSAAAIYHLRTGEQQQIHVCRAAAEAECTAYFKLNGKTPDSWEKFSGLYATRDGWVRIHANFAHHRDGVLDLLNLPKADQAEPDDVRNALSGWGAEAFESAAAERGLVVSMVRDFATWAQHPQHLASLHQPPVRITRIGDAPARKLPPLAGFERPLTGVRVLDLTRILAGPICGRTLAAYGADVMLINSPGLPNIPAITDTSRGKRSAHLDLKTTRGLQTLRDLLHTSHVFVQGYRPGGLSDMRLAPADLAKIRPGIVYVSLSAYGNYGPWATRRGFDSLVQTAAGFNHAEAAAAGSATPKSMPVPILDYASGFLMAFGAQAALWRQLQEGGSWHVEVSLLQTANWLRGLGRLTNGFSVPQIDVRNRLQQFPCKEGELYALPHAAEFSRTPATWVRASAPPGTDPPRW